MTIETRTRATRAAVAALAVAAAGCHPRAPLPATMEGEWAAARDASTRRFVLYDGFTHRATATATLLSLPVREARARRLAEWLGWTQKELDDRLAQERAEHEAGEEFLLAFYAADSRAQDLDAPKSVWRVALKVDGADVLARHVTAAERNANLLGLFPYVGTFDVAYRVLFPRPASGDVAAKPFVLEISSGLGKVVLDYAQAPKRPVDEPWQPVPPEQ